MPGTSAAVFVSYARDDAGLALKLAKDLKGAGVSVWIDQLDILPGERWDRAVEIALEGSKCLLIIVSPLSVASDNVMDEVSYAIDERKDVVPVLAAKCRIPLRMRRLQFIDFTDDYGSSFKHLLIRLKTDRERNKDTTEKASDVSTREKMRSAPVGNVSGPFSAGTTPPKTSVLSRLSRLQKKTIAYQGHTIGIGTFGQDTIWYDGKEVSRKNSFSSSDHSFRVIEEGREVIYEVKTVDRWFGASWAEVKRNGEVIFND